MTQDTGGLNFCAATVEYSTNFSDWTAISGFAVAIAVAPAERAVGTQSTFDGDTKVVRGGKREIQDLTVRIMYTETTTDPFLTFVTQFETACGGQLDLRYTVDAGTAGDYQFTTDQNNTVFKTLGYPQGEADSPDITVVDVIVTTAKLDDAIMA